MSRRLYALAAMAALIATPALADPECFSTECSSERSMPTVMEPPVAVQTPDVDALPPAIEEPQIAATTKVRPQMVVDPARPVVEQAYRAPVEPPQPPEAAYRAPPDQGLRPKIVPARPAQPEPRYSVEAAPRAPARQERRRDVERARPVRQVEQYAPAPVRAPRHEAPAAERTESVYVVNQGPAYSSAPPSPSYPVNQGPSYGGVTVNAPVQNQNHNVVVVAPYMRPDPAWKQCQMDARARRDNAVCGPASYHPYGAGGYRPYGTYRQPQYDSNVVMTAPSARIIQIESDEY